tara:strand:+ start:671 stop:1465 length:795 start_codon:yes stop_codon:yes gene_type:complete
MHNIHFSQLSFLKRVIVTPDKHFPLADMSAIRVVCKAIELVKPDTYVDLGDTGEWGSFSHWKWKKKKKPPLEYIQPDMDAEIKAVNEGMDIIDSSLEKAKCKDKHFLQGNHELWLDQFVDEHPYLPQYMTENALNLKERGYKYHHNSKFLKLGKLYFHHGNFYGGQYHSANHIRKLGCNIMYGHTHDVQMHSATMLGGQVSAISLGCLKDMSKQSNAWLGGREHNWSHAFAIVDFFDKGYFTTNVIQIIKGKAVVWGKLIDGNK